MPVQPGVPVDGPATALVIESPSFAIAAQHGIVILAGHASSRSHEAQMRQAAEEHYPTRSHVSEFRPFGPAPEWWADATAALVGATTSMLAPRVWLNDGALVVRALARQPTTTEKNIAAIAGSLPVALKADIRILDAGPDVTARSLCDRHFKAFSNGPINFLESQTKMRPSAYPELERVVALAAACRDATISITGHTDSSGNEDWNLSLSLQRARVVSDWLVGHGIETDRIVVVGAGSSNPIANNETRYGRSLNRRIDIALTYED